MKTQPNLWLLLASLAAVLLSGCAGLSPAKLETAQPAAQKVVTGIVHGGQQPVSGATIQLYAVNLTAMQGSVTPLFNSTVTTTAYGNFSFDPTFKCPDGSLVYITATGGDPGIGSPNPALALMAGLGPCSAITQNTYVSINELTTVASVYALAPFMADITHVGAPANNLAGITRAFATINSLVNTSNGSVPGAALPANGVVPVTELNTVADILAVCVNSPGNTSACSALFAATPSSTGTLPTDTISSALNLTRSPASSVPALYYIALPSSPFQPTLKNAPQDWTLAIRYTGGGITAPHGIALDASGNVWIANEGAFSVTELNPFGLPLSGASGYSDGDLLAPQAIAIDVSGNAWIANSGGNSVVKLSPAGVSASGAEGFTSGIYAPVDIAVDASGNAWVANLLDNSVVKLSPTGGVLAGPLQSSGLLTLPTAVALDPSGTLWVSSSGTGTLVRVSGSGSLLTTGSTDQFLQGPAQIAFDTTGDAFVAAPGSSTVSAFDTTGAALPASPYLAAGLNTPVATAVDGANTIWLANNAGSLSHLTAAGVALSPATGLGILASPLGLAIDATGSIWTTSSGDDSVSQFVGLATPVALPLASRTQ